MGKQEKTVLCPQKRVAENKFWALASHPESIRLLLERTSKWCWLLERMVFVVPIHLRCSAAIDNMKMNV